MITIQQNDNVVTLINVFACEPQNQQALIDAWIWATEETLGKVPGVISATLHRSKDGTRVVNYGQWTTSEGWQKLLEAGKSSYFAEMGKFAKPDAHLYEVCYQLDRTKGAASPPFPPLRKGRESFPSSRSSRNKATRERNRFTRRS